MSFRYHTNMVIAAHLLIAGHVQGVFFRAEAARTAKREGVGGWVRNRRDGRVEVYVVGPKPSVNALIAWCRHGPPMADVDDIHIEWTDAVDQSDSFEIRYA